MPPKRRQQIVDAAMHLAAKQGTRALTHTRLDDYAGVPRGTAKNYLPTRDDILLAILNEVSADAYRLQDALREIPVPTLEALTPLVAGFLRRLLYEDRERTVARHVVYALAPFGGPAVLKGWQDLHRRWIGIIEHKLREAGVQENSWSTAKWVLACVDGIILDEMQLPDPEFDPERSVRMIIEAVLKEAT